ncbi:MAG: hypothetical protein ACRC6G_00995 [Deefgea sp.]
MNLETAKTIIANWDKPLIRQVFWYLVIPAHVTIQRAETMTYRYCNVKQIPYRLIYLLKFIFAVGLFVVVDRWVEASILSFFFKLGIGYFAAMYAVWVLAYWSMKKPKQAKLD